MLLSNMVIIEGTAMLILFYAILNESTLFNKNKIGIDRPNIVSKLDIFIGNISTLIKINKAEYMIFMYSFTFIAINILMAFTIQAKGLMNKQIMIYLTVVTTVIIFHLFIQYTMYLKYFKIYANLNNGLSLKDTVASHSLNIIKQNKEREISIIQNSLCLKERLVSYLDYSEEFDRLLKIIDIDKYDKLSKEEFNSYSVKFNEYYFYIKDIHLDKIIELELNLDKDKIDVYSVYRYYNKLYLSLSGELNESGMKLSMFVEVILYFIILNVAIFL